MLKSDKNVESKIPEKKITSPPTLAAGVLRKKNALGQTEINRLVIEQVFPKLNLIGERPVKLAVKTLLKGPNLYY
jgi:hypothetical protein